MEKKLALGHGGEGVWARPWRWAKTAFFLVSMLASLLLVCAPPLLVVLLDLLLPPALLSSFLRAGHAAASAHTLLDQARAFHFRSSLLDLPAVSAARSLLILCAYTACGGGAAYLWVAAACSVGSLFYVLAKAVAVFGVAADGAAGLDLHGKGQALAVEAMFLMSLVLAAVHLAMVYRASSREKHRLHVIYRIDIEAFKPEEIAGIIKDFDEPRHLAPTVFFLGGTKYMVIQVEPGVVIRGKKGIGGVTIKKTGMADRAGGEGDPDLG